MQKNIVGFLIWDGGIHDETSVSTKGISFCSNHGTNLVVQASFEILVLLLNFHTPERNFQSQLISLFKDYSRTRCISSFYRVFLHVDIYIPYIATVRKTGKVLKKRMCYFWWLKSGFKRLRLGSVYPMIYRALDIHPRWLFGVSEPSTVSQNHIVPTTIVPVQAVPAGRKRLPKCGKTRQGSKTQILESCGLVDGCYAIQISSTRTDSHQTTQVKISIWTNMGWSWGVFFEWANPPLNKWVSKAILGDVVSAA